MAEFAIRRIQRRLQGLEDAVSEARLAEAMASGAWDRKEPRRRQSALTEEIARVEARLLSLIAADDDHDA